jgi:hypothetical protein
VVVSGVSQICMKMAVRPDLQSQPNLITPCWISWKLAMALAMMTRASMSPTSLW